MSDFSSGIVSEFGPCFDANLASVFSAWFAFAVNLGSGISAVDSCSSVDVKSDFGAGTAAVISAFVSMFVLDFVTDVVTDFSSSAFGPDLDSHTIWATVAGMVSAANPDIARAVDPICGPSEVSYFGGDVVPGFGPDFRRSDSGIVSELSTCFDANSASVFSGWFASLWILVQFSV